MSTETAADPRPAIAAELRRLADLMDGYADLMPHGVAAYTRREDAVALRRRASELSPKENR